MTDLMDEYSRLLIAACNTGDAMREIHSTVQLLQNSRSKYYFEYGLSRRLLLIEANLRYFLEHIPPQRTEPLDNQTSLNAIIHINSLYVNLYGCIDNLAWTLTYEMNLFPNAVNIEADKDLRSKVALFKDSFLTMLPVNFSAYKKYITSMKRWFDALSKNRHPSSHRIPLYVVPAILNKTESEAYLKEFQNHQIELSKGNIQQAGVHLDKLKEYGKFSPMFLHDPDEEFSPLYPTITNDCIILLETFNRTNALLIEYLKTT